MIHSVSPQLPSSAALGDRSAGLSPAASAHLHSASRAMLRNDGAGMQQDLREVLAEVPDHVEALRLLAIAHRLRGQPGQAMTIVHHALARHPDDALLLNTFGTLLREAGRHDSALGVFRRVCELQPELASAWLNLGMTLQARAQMREAESAFARALRIEPNHAIAHVGHADVLNLLGRGSEAATGYRDALRLDPLNARAWAGLTELDGMTLDAGETTLLGEVHAQADPAGEDRALLAFALGRTLEDQRRYADAFAMFHQANAAMRRLVPWDAPAHSRGIEAVARAFDTPPRGNPDPTCGRDVVFVVGLPCAGSSLVEQVLAAHADIEGAGELPDLAHLVRSESVRHGKPLAQWATEADQSDWARLGQAYLERTARCRLARPVHVDRTLSNWPLVGAIRAMLPAARIVNCRRDALETGWSIYTRRFVRGQHAFAHDLADIGACWVDYDRLMYTLHARHPGQIHELACERLVAEPERQVRALLAYCGLPFDPACLRFHAGDRAAGTPGMAQARRPLPGDTARARHYGTLLDPLRQALGL